MDIIFIAACIAVIYTVNSLINRGLIKFEIDPLLQFIVSGGSAVIAGISVLALLVQEGFARSAGIIAVILILRVRWWCWLKDTNRTTEPFIRTDWLPWKKDKNKDVELPSDKVLDEKADVVEEKPVALPPAELVHLAKAILEDDVVSQDEAEALLTYLNSIPITAMEPITRDLFQAVDFALSDGILDALEADEVRVLLGEICDLNLKRTVVPDKAKPKKVQSYTPKKKKPPRKDEVNTGRPIRYRMAQLSIGDVVEMLYEDAFGNLSDRKVTLAKANRKDGNVYLYGRCHTRRALRTFRADRIITLTNCATGELVFDPEEALLAARSN